MASTTINDSYSIGMGDKNITLTVTISKSQIAKSTVRLNRKLVNDFQDSFTVKLGKAKDIVGSTLTINTTEADVDPNSDITSFELEITGGKTPYVNKRSQSVASGGFVIYTVEIVFIP